jgi:hypothetical protein
MAHFANAQAAVPASMRLEQARLELAQQPPVLAEIPRCSWWVISCHTTREKARLVRRDFLSAVAGGLERPLQVSGIFKWFSFLIEMSKRSRNINTITTIILL